MISNRIASPVSILLRLLCAAFTLLVSENELSAQWQPAVHIRHRSGSSSVIFRTSARNVVMAMFTAFDGKRNMLYDLNSIVTDTVPIRSLNGFERYPPYLYGKSIQCDGDPALDYFDIVARFNVLTPQEDTLGIGNVLVAEYHDYDNDGLDDVLYEERGHASVRHVVLFGDSTSPLQQKTWLRIRTDYDIDLEHVVVKAFGRELRVVSYGWNDNAMRGVMGMYGISLDSLASRPDTVDLQPIQTYSFYLKSIYDDSLEAWNLLQGGHLHFYSDTAWYLGIPNLKSGKMTRVTSTGMTVVTVDSTMFRSLGADLWPDGYWGTHSWAGHPRSFVPIGDTSLVQSFYDYADTNLRYYRLARVVVRESGNLHLVMSDSITWRSAQQCTGLNEAAIIPDIDGDDASEILINRQVSESSDSCINYFEIYLSTGKILSAYTEPQRMELPQVTRTQGGWLVPRSLCTQAPDHVPAYAINGSLIGILSSSDYDSENYFIADPPNAITGVVLTVFGTCSLRLQ